MARPLLPVRVGENMAKPPNHPVSRTLAKNLYVAAIVKPLYPFFLPSLLFFKEQWHMGNISLLLKLVLVL